MQITVPDSPRDGFTISGFVIDQDVCHCPAIVPLKLVYHANTSWDKIGAPFKHGADLVDCWQILRNGEFVGRMVGWKRIHSWLGQVSGGFFLTRKKAAVSARHMAEDAIAYHRGRIEQMAETLKKLKRIQGKLPEKKFVPGAPENLDLALIKLADEYRARVTQLGRDAALGQAYKHCTQFTPWSQVVERMNAWERLANRKP